VVVVVVGRARGVGRQEQIVGAQSVALRVGVREDARLQQLVVGVADARDDQGRAEGLCEEGGVELLELRGGEKRRKEERKK